VAHVPLEQRSTARLLIGFVGTIILPVAAAFVVVAIVAASHTRSFSSLGGRTHLKSIPVSQAACPSVVAMHDAANAFQNETPVFGLGSDGRGHLVRWPATRPALRHAADVLDVTIAAGIPHVPAPVQDYLTRVRVNIKQGREQAALANDPTAYMQRVQPLVTNGQSAFGFASDLVGHACSVDLGADNGVVTAMHP
jgi:hypothetical protein